MIVRFDNEQRDTYEPVLLSFLQENADYFLECENCEPTPELAAEFFESIPSGLAPENKLLLGVFEGEGLMAFWELYKDRHSKSEWLISTMIVSKPHRAKGFGKKVYAKLERFMAAEGAEVVILGVVSENVTAIHFWQSVGYIDTGIVQIQSRNGHTKSIKVFEKQL